MDIAQLKGVFVEASVRKAMAGAACLTLLLLASCSGGSGDQTSQQPRSLELFATVSSQYIAFDPSGVLYATVPQGTPPGNGSGQPSELFSFSPAGQPSDKSVSMIGVGGLTFDATGNLYFTETRSCIMHFCDVNVGRMAPDGTISRASVTACCFGGGTTFSPGRLGGVAVDAADNAYVSDTVDSAIRKVAPNGGQSLFAGPAGDSGPRCTGVDGSAATFCGPTGLAIDAAGNVYVADTGGNTIRKVTPGGVVITVAGVSSVVGSMDGPAASATFNAPTQVAIDGQGNLYVADTGNALIRRISTSGNVTTVAGTLGARGFAPGPLPGTLDPPTGLAIHGDDLYFAMPGAIGRIQSIN
jgi:sugar lactone lactonase YvrE